jgi:hypothetical protein
MSFKTREYTNKVLEAVEEGLLDRDMVIMACLKYMSESDVKDMCEANEFFDHEEEIEYKVFNIKWDIDETEDSIELPNIMYVTVPYSEDPEDFISNEITEKTGFCHKGFEFEEETGEDIDNPNWVGSRHHY